MSDVPNTDFNWENVHNTPIPLVAMGTVLLLFVLSVRPSVMRDHRDTVETHEKLSKWRKQGKNITGYLEQSFLKILKKQFQTLHLWISIVFRPRGDSFHSFDRLICLLVFIFVTFAVNAILYGFDTSNVPYINDFFVISFVSGLAGTAATLILVPLFARSGPPSAREQFLAERIKEVRNEVEFRTGTAHRDSDTQRTASRQSNECHCYCCCCGDRFPAWVRYLGFGFAVVAVLGSIAAVLYCMIQFKVYGGNIGGYDIGLGPGVVGNVSQSWKWLFSCLLSCILDLIIFRPLEVLFVSIVIRCQQKHRNDVSPHSAQIEENFRKVTLG